MADPDVDTLVLPFAEKLIICLCAQLASTLGGAVCQCSLRPGSAPPPADACCLCPDGKSGQAAVQITDIFPVIAGKFPQRGGNVILDNCGSYEWAAELTMTVYRCVSVADEDGFPSADELTLDTRKIMADARAMRRAMLCCDWHNREDIPDEKWPIVPGAWRPLSPQGGCAGGQQSVIVLLGSECCV